MLPASLPCGYGQPNILSRQTNDVGTYENIVGLPPSDGSQEQVWNGTGYVTYQYSGGAWSPANPPDLAVGQGAKFIVPGGTQNGSLVYQGLTNYPAGNATLAVLGSELVVSNLSSSGQDGVSIALPSSLTGLDVQLQNADPSNALPVGAYVEGTLIGTGGTVTNGLLGTLTMTKTDTTGDYQLDVNYEPMGATNCTVLAYLNGQLVGQESNVPDGLLRKIIGHLLISIGTGLLQNSISAGIEADFGTAVVYQTGAGSNIVCDTLFIYPGNVSTVGMPTALQITASQVPSLTITSENASLVYQGLTNTSVGNASFVYQCLTCHNLTITYQGGSSTGQNGVSIALPGSLTGLDVQFEDVDSSNTLPVGAYVGGQLIGTANAVTNGIMGTLIMTKTDTDTYEMDADFEAVGVTNASVYYYLNGQLVGQELNVPDGLLRKIIGHILVSVGTWLANGSGGLAADFGGSSVTATMGSGSNVVCDTIAVIPNVPGNVSVLGASTALQITASQVPSLTIDTENTSLVYQGLTNTSVGSASLVFEDPCNGCLGHRHLNISYPADSTGQNGVSIALPGSLTGLDVQFEDVDSSNTLPVGAYVQSQLIGTANGINNGVLGKLTATKSGTSSYGVSADFSPVGANTYTVQAYNQGVLVAQATNQSAANIIILPPLGPFSMDIENFDFVERLTMDFQFPIYVMIAGQAVTCDKFAFIPENVVFPSAPTAFQIVASQVPSLTIDTENASLVYQGLTNTSVGNASFVPGYGCYGQPHCPSLTISFPPDSSSNQDGVSIALPGSLTGLDVQFEDVDSSNTLPVGAYVGGQLIGTANAVTNGIMGTLIMTKTDTDTYEMDADFEAVGVTNASVYYYLNGQLVGQELNVPDGLLRKIIGHILVSVGTWLANGSGGLAADFGGSSVTATMGSGSNVVCDTIAVIPNVPGNVSVLGASTALQITASQVPSLTIDTENTSLVYQGLTNTSVGSASLVFEDPCNGCLGHRHLNISYPADSTGQNGVSIALPGSLTGLDVQFEDVDSSNTLPVGAYVGGQLIGTANAVTNGIMGTLIMTKTDTDTYEMDADFEAVGVTNASVYYYLNGQLVGQELNVPDGLLRKIIGHILVSVGTWLANGSGGLAADFGGSSVTATMGSGSNVVCDTIAVIPNVPGNVSVLGASTALQITASQVPSLTIDSESASLVFQGLTNTSVGNVSLVPGYPGGLGPGHTLTISYLAGSSGNDGVSIALPSSLTGLDVQLQNADPSNALPVGAYVEGTLIGTGGTVTNGLLGTLTMTKTDTTGDYQLDVNYEPMGATNCTVLAYLNGQLVGQESNVPDGLLRKIIGHLLISIGTGLLQNSISAGIEADFGTAVVYQTGAGSNIVCDTLFIYPGNVSTVGMPTALQITAFQVPSLIITSENESLIYAGFNSTSLGSAAMALSGSELAISSLGSSGEDGVSFAMPTNLTGVDFQYQNEDESNQEPVGGYVQETIIGTAGLVTNGILGTLTMTKTGTTNYLLAVNFESIGATNCTVQAYLAGTLVAQETNVPDSIFRKIWAWIKSTWNSMGVFGQTGSPLLAATADTSSTFVYQTGAGSNVVCDTLLIVPGNVSITNKPTALRSRPRRCLS